MRGGWNWCARPRGRRAATWACSAICRARKSASTASWPARCSWRTAREFTLDAALAVDAGTESSVGIAYKKLPTDVFAGDVLLLNDGQISLQVLGIDGSAHQDPRAGRRRTRQQQGHQPPGRRPVGGRADRQGSRGYPHGGAAQGGLPRRVLPARCRGHGRSPQAAARCRRPWPAGGEDRARRSHQESGGGGAGERRGDGRPRRPRRGDGLRGTGGPAEADHPGSPPSEPRRHHGDADDGIDDHQHHSDARRGVGCGERRHGRHRCRDAVRRNRVGQASGQGRGGDGADHRRRGEVSGRARADQAAQQRLFRAHGRGDRRRRSCTPRIICT